MPSQSHLKKKYLENLNCHKCKKNSSDSVENSSDTYKYIAESHNHFIESHKNTNKSHKDTNKSKKKSKKIPKYVTKTHDEPTKYNNNSDKIKADCCDQFKNLNLTKYEKELIFGDEANIDLVNCNQRVKFRKLWSEHAIYTRFFIISTLANIPDTDLIAARLLRNQVDIGNFVKPFVGINNGKKLTKLLQEHIKAAAAAINAVKSENEKAINAAVANVFQNSQKVSAFISKLNPKKLPYDIILEHFNQHNQYVIDMTVVRSQGDFATDIKIFDLYYSQILKFSDLILSGLC